MSPETGVLGAAEEGDPWSLRTGDGIDGLARMIESNKNPRQANDKRPYIKLTHTRSNKVNVMVVG